MSNTNNQPVPVKESRGILWQALTLPFRLLLALLSLPKRIRSSTAWQVLAEAWVAQNEVGQPLNRSEQERKLLPATLELDEAPISPLGRIVGRIVMFCIVIAFLWAAVAPLSIQVTMYGRTVPQGRVQVIEPLGAATVRQVHVQNGNVVQRGDQLLTLDPTEIVADQSRLQDELLTAKLDIQRLQITLTAIANDDLQVRPEFVGPEQEVARQSFFLQSVLAAREAENEALASEEERLRAEIDKLRDTAAARQQVVATAEQRLEMYEQMMHDGKQTLAREEFLMIQQEYQRTVVELTQSSGEILELQAALATLTARRDEGTQKMLEQTHRELAQAKQRARAASQELTKANKREQRSRMAAPISGTVAGLAVHRVGEVVQPGEQLMIIVPDDAGLEIEAMLQNRDRGDITVGQPVRVKLAAYAFTKYGTLRGEVAHISADATEVEGHLLFPVRVRLLDQSIWVRGEEVRLGSGMSVVAEVHSGSRTVLGYLFTPLARIADEALRER